MDTYHVVIDHEMIRNTLQTNLSESMDLMSSKLAWYVFLLGLLPSYLVYKTPLVYQAFLKEIWAKAKTIFIALTIMGILLLSFSKFYTSFFREHKSLRYYTNPTYWLYSIGKYIDKTMNAGPILVREIGTDARIMEESDEKEKELVILVVGESARADRFSLNGYTKETNPLLKKEDIITFPNVVSCGTSTAVSVPCMFSSYDQEHYNYKSGISTENVLDILKHTNDVQILWRDNNSDSKGVALRVEYEDFRTSKKNPICDEECRDEGMLKGLDAYIEKHKDKDILIILHQMGNHGPAYYKRYPKEFERFKPACHSNQIETCSQEEVSNAYDNVILYTDYFLSKVISFLKKYSTTHETAMIYISDHGESLGENGLYLHGMPYFIAPDTQKNVATLMWLGDKIKEEDINEMELKTHRNDPFTQDYLFHTLLSIFEVDTKEYNQALDMLHSSKRNHH